MIFVTVGTHEQPFNRLVAEVDRLRRNGIIQTEVVIQTGYTDYIPLACQYKSMMGFHEMEQLIARADIVITHGGPGSIFGVLKQFKIPIVVPRRSDYNEHVDMHQCEFARHLQQRNNVLTVFDIEDLEDKIINYNGHIGALGGATGRTDQLKEFVVKLDDVVNQLFGR